MRSTVEIEADMDALGRPRLSSWTLAEVRRSLSEARAWDELNPGGAARYAALVREWDEAQREEAARAADLAHAERLERRLQARLNDAGMGDRQRAAALSPKETEALTAARHWYSGQRAWLLLCGGPGCGKTVAAGWCLVAAVKAGKSATQRKAQELARLSGFEEGAAELERLKHVDLLVVDDVGSEKASDWARAVLFELLDARHESGLRTILTSNLRPNALAQHLGERLADRIREDCSTVTVGGTTLRRSGQPVGESK